MLIFYGFFLDRNVFKYYVYLVKNVVINMVCVGVGFMDKKEFKDIVLDLNYVWNVDFFEEFKNKVFELV